MNQPHCCKYFGNKICLNEITDQKDRQSLSKWSNPSILFPLRSTLNASGYLPGNDIIWCREHVANSADITGDQNSQWSHSSPCMLFPMYTSVIFIKLRYYCVNIIMSFGNIILLLQEWIFNILYKRLCEHHITVTVYSRHIVPFICIRF